MRRKRRRVIKTPVTRAQWLATGDAYPCSHLALVPALGKAFALPSLIPEPQVYYGGDEPQLDDELLAARYGMRNAEFAGAVRPDAMLRA